MADSYFDSSNGYDVADAEMIDEAPAKAKGDDPFEFHEIDDYDLGPISEEDAWTVIAAHFQERGLVGQQLDSFDNFMTSTMQVCYYLSFSLFCLANLHFC